MSKSTPTQANQNSQPLLEQRKKDLTTILRTHRSLPREVQEKTINLIIGFLQSAALVQEITQDTDLGVELKEFDKLYLDLFKADITQTGASDYPQETMDHLVAIKAIDSNATNLEEKRQAVLQHFGNTEELAKFRQDLVKQGDHKYQHAAVRNYRNYPKLLNAIFKENGQSSLSDRKSSLEQITDEGEFFWALSEVNKQAALSDNFSIIKRVFGTDGMEEHDLINQASRHRQLLDCAAMLEVMRRDYGNDPKTFFTELSKAKSIKTVTKENNIDTSKPANEQTPLFDIKQLPALREKSQKAAQNLKDNNGLEITVGLEEEHLLLPIGGPAAELERAKNRSEFNKIIRFTGDLDSRKNMRNNYHYNHDSIGNTPNALLLYSEQEITAFKQKNTENQNAFKTKKRQEIAAFLEDQTSSSDYSPEEKNQLRTAAQNVDLLNDEELYFFDMFFLRYDEAKAHKLELDGVFNHRASLRDNLVKEGVLEVMARTGSFYYKTLDMIRAHEIAIGEFKVQEGALEEKEKTINFTREIAAEHGLRSKDRDVQINIGINYQDKNILVPTVSGTGSDVKIEVSQAYVKVMNAMQQGLLNAINANPSIVREGQEKITFALDRKKGGMKEMVAQSKYYKNAAPNDLDGSAFPTHRDNTGKAGMMRGAVISLGRGIGVLEIRLIGNNSHIPDYDEYVKPVYNSIDVLPETVLLYLLEQLQTLKIDPQDLENKVEIREDGTVPGINPVEINAFKNKTGQVEGSSISTVRQQAKIKQYPTVSQDDGNGTPTTTGVKYPKSTARGALVSQGGSQEI